MAVIATLTALLGLSALATTAAGRAVVGPRGPAAPDHDPDKGFVYAEAYRLRIAINDEYAASAGGADYDYEDILPQVREKPYYWLSYKPASRDGRGGRAIAVAQRGAQRPRRAPVFYEQLERVGDGETWRAWTDTPAVFSPPPRPGPGRLTFDIQYLDEFDAAYPAEHGVFLTGAAGEGDRAVGAAPTDPPQLWGRAPGTYLVCAGRRFEGDAVPAIRFAYAVLNETEPARLPRGCVPVRLEARCAPLDPPVRNRTWDHERLLEAPCVWDPHHD